MFSIVDAAADAATICAITLGFFAWHKSDYDASNTLILKLFFNKKKKKHIKKFFVLKTHADQYTAHKITIESHTIKWVDNNSRSHHLWWWIDCVCMFECAYARETEREKEHTENA